MSNDGTNTKSIKSRTNKSIGTRNTIKALVKGLGIYTIESGVIYFKSLLRGSLLYATEAMINIKETDIKIIERAEASTMLVLLKTEMGTPRHILYLDFGVLSVRYVNKQCSRKFSLETNL